MPTYNLTVVDQDTLIIATVEDVTLVTAPAAQGPAGPQNLFVGPTPPSSPYVGLVWADTSSTQDVPPVNPGFVWAVISS